MIFIGLLVFQLQSAQVREYDHKSVDAYYKVVAGLHPPITLPVLALTDPASVSAGERLYKKNCAVCHGAELEGGLGSNLKDGVWLNGGLPSQVIHSIFEGVPEKGMPSWGVILGEKQVQQLAGFVLSKNPPLVLFEKSPPDSQSGEKLYLGSCAMCHGRDLKGVVAGSLLDDQWLNGGQLSQITHSIEVGVPKKGMPGWGRILSEQQIAAVAKYVFEKNRVQTGINGVDTTDGAKKQIKNCSTCHETDMSKAVRTDSVKWPSHDEGYRFPTPDYTQQLPSQGAVYGARWVEQGSPPNHQNLK